MQEFVLADRSRGKSSRHIPRRVSQPHAQQSPRRRVAVVRKQHQRCDAVRGHAQSQHDEAATHACVLQCRGMIVSARVAHAPLSVAIPDAARNGRPAQTAQLECEQRSRAGDRDGLQRDADSTRENALPRRGFARSARRGVAIWEREH